MRRLQLARTERDATERLPLGSRPARARTPGGVLLFALLAIALATPAFAMAAHAPASVPSCTHFSRVKMAQLIHVGSLELEGRGPVGNNCEYKGPHVPEHYADLLAVSVTATSKAVFLKAQHLAKTAPGVYGAVKIRGAVAFDVIHVIHGEGACRSPGGTLGEFGPPLCSGQPDWSTITVYAYGPLKPRGPKAFVTVGLAGQEENTFLGYVISIDKKILSGQIR